DREKNEVGTAATAPDGTGVQQHHPRTSRGELVPDLEVRHDRTARKYLPEERAQTRNVPVAIPELVDELPGGLLRGDVERLVEGSICRMDAEVRVEHEKRLPNGIHDRLGVEPGLAQRLGCDVGEGDDDAVDPIV